MCVCLTLAVESSEAVASFCPHLEKTQHLTWSEWPRSVMEIEEEVKSHNYTITRIAKILLQNFPLNSIRANKGSFRPSIHYKYSNRPRKIFTIEGGILSIFHKEGLNIYFIT